MKDSDKTLIPDRLALARKQLNISKAEAARRIGLTAASYVRYEAGDRSPSPQPILRAFSISVVCIYSGLPVSMLETTISHSIGRSTKYLKSKPYFSV